MSYIILALALIASLGAFGTHHYRSAYIAEEQGRIADAAAVKAVADLQAMHSKEIDGKNNQLQQQKDALHAKRETELTTSLAVANKRMLDAAKSLGSGGVSRTGFTAQVCDDEAGNTRLREILRRHQQAVGAAVADYQRGISQGIVSPASQSSISLGVMREWAAEQERNK